MWGVRRRDAARHKESGWLIRPDSETGDALLLSLFLGGFPLDLLFAADTSSPSLLAGVQVRPCSRYPDLPGQDGRWRLLCIR